MQRYSVLAVVALLSMASVSHAGDIAAQTMDKPTSGDVSAIFNEARFGTLVSIDDENGVFATGVVFFDPWGHSQAAGFDKFWRPRLHLGAAISTSGDTNQVFAGFSWTADVTERLFVEIGLGATVHDGNIDDIGSDESARLGCRALFHEYAAVGYDLTNNWSVIAQLEHASHANLCDGPNNGLSRAGLLVSYHF